MDRQYGNRNLVRAARCCGRVLEGGEVGPVWRPYSVLRLHACTRSQEVLRRDSTVALSRSSCSLSSGVIVSKSEASKTWRISISASPPGSGSGQRLTHSIASSIELTWNIQKPAISSLSGNGPVVTVRLPPENLMRAPLRAGLQPFAGEHDAGIH